MRYIKHIDPAFIDKEPFEQSLNDDQALAQHQNNSIDPSTPSVENCQKGVLREKCKGKENKVNQERYEGEREDPGGKEWPEFAITEVEPDTTDSI